MHPLVHLRTLRERVQGHALRPVVSRNLQQTTPQVTAVSTPQQLLTAVTRGDTHIEVRQHLDLTTVTARDNIEDPVLLGNLPESIQSIRVRYACMLQACMCLPVLRA
jgi:hypothetical protein